MIKIRSILRFLVVASVIYSNTSLAVKMCPTGFTVSMHAVPVSDYPSTVLGSVKRTVNDCVSLTWTANQSFLSVQEHSGKLGTLSYIGGFDTSFQPDKSGTEIGRMDYVLVYKTVDQPETTMPGGGSIILPTNDYVTPSKLDCNQCNWGLRIGQITIKPFDTNDLPDSNPTAQIWQQLAHTESLNPFGYRLYINIQYEARASGVTLMWDKTELECKSTSGQCETTGLLSYSSTGGNGIGVLSVLPQSSENTVKVSADLGSGEQEITAPIQIEISADSRTIPVRFRVSGNAGNAQIIVRTQLSLL